MLIEAKHRNDLSDPLLLHAANKWRLISKDFAWSLFEDSVDRLLVHAWWKIHLGSMYNSEDSHSP